MNKAIHKKTKNNMPHADWMSAGFIQGLVSVIVPVYNRAHLITEALDSVYAQEYRPIELIVVDDGSTDGTSEIVRNWFAAHASEDFLVNLIKQENSGAQVARNAGLQSCQGEFIQFLDSDDVLFPEKIKTQVKAIADSSASYAYGKSEYCDKNGTVYSIRGFQRPKNGPWITLHAWSANSPLFKREVCVSVGPWDTTLHGCQEYEYAARVKAMEYEYVFINKVLDRARAMGGHSISTQKSNDYAKAIELAAERILFLLDQQSHQPASEYNRIAQNLTATALRYSRNGDQHSALRCLKKASSISWGAWRFLACINLVGGRILTPRVWIEGIRFIFTRLTTKPFT